MNIISKIQEYKSILPDFPTFMLITLGGKVPTQILQFSNLKLDLSKHDSRNQFLLIL